MIETDTNRNSERSNSEPVSLRLGLAPDVWLARDAGRAILIRWPRSRELKKWDRSFEVLLNQLSANGGIEINHDLIGGHSQARSECLLEVLLDEGWLTISVFNGVSEKFTVFPRRQAPSRELRSVLEPRLSRHLVLVPTSDGWVLEAPHSWCDIQFRNLAQARRCLEASKMSDIERQILLWCGVFVDPLDEDSQFTHRQWSSHELWFHERSRRYGREAGFGGTFWARGEFPAPPLRPPGSDEVAIYFDAVDSDLIDAQSISLNRALEDRRSIRRHNDEKPLELSQLGEFLYRTARVRLVQEVDGVEYGSKPYPSGGSVYEIEVYLLVRHVQDLAPGLWRYDPTEHGLVCLKKGLEDANISALLREATHSSTINTSPQVTILMAPRFGRILWKYEQMGYAVILKHVGVLMQTMYLVATDMGLAACAIGSGDSDLFSRATGLDPLDCTTVGEFILGTPHPEERFQERPV